MALLKEIKEDVSKIQDDTKVYIETSVEYYKLRGFKIAAKSITVFLKLLLVTVTAVLMLICGSIAASLAIGDALENVALGFLIMAGFYLILLIVFVFARPRMIEKSILRRFSEIFFND